nr:MAG TPA: hypothetical protein [Caudoviricetes sp.]
MSRLLSAEWDTLAGPHPRKAAPPHTRHTAGTI